MKPTWCSWQTQHLFPLSGRQACRRAGGRAVEGTRALHRSAQCYAKAPAPAPCALCNGRCGAGAAKHPGPALGGTSPQRQPSIKKKATQPKSTPPPPPPPPLTPALPMPPLGLAQTNPQALRTWRKGRPRHPPGVPQAAPRRPPDALTAAPKLRVRKSQTATRRILVWRRSGGKRATWAGTSTLQSQ